MMPFHRFTRDLVETAQFESPLATDNVLVFYFHNVPGSHLYRDLYLTTPIPTSEVLEQCGDTSVLIVSDGGTKPERLRIRPPSFVNLQAIGQMSVGSMIADLVAVIGTLDIVLGEIDR